MKTKVWTNLYLRPFPTKLIENIALWTESQKMRFTRIKQFPFSIMAWLKVHTQLVMPQGFEQITSASDLYITFWHMTRMVYESAASIVAYTVMHLILLNLLTMFATPGWNCCAKLVHH